MGIDIYMRWPGQEEEDRKVGYLRESYHGAPYATKVLVPETWEDWVPDGLSEEEHDKVWENGVPIPAAKLRERLPLALWAACVRRAEVYNDVDMRRAIMNSTGYEPRFNASDDPSTVDLTGKAESTEEMLQQIVPMIAQRVGESRQEQKLPAMPEWWENRAADTGKPLYEIVAEQVKGNVLNILDFVRLAERKEAELGHPVGILNSY